MRAQMHVQCAWTISPPQLKAPSASVDLPNPCLVKAVVETDGHGSNRTTEPIWPRAGLRCLVDTYINSEQPSNSITFHKAT